MRNIFKLGTFCLLLVSSLPSSVFAFQTKADEIKINSHSLSNQDELTLKLYKRATVFAKKFFSKYSCQVVDHNIHFSVWDDTDFKQPQKEVENKYKPIAEKAKINIYNDCLYYEFLTDHCIDFTVFVPNGLISLNYRLSKLPGPRYNWPCCKKISKIDSLVNNFLNKDSSIHWSTETDMESCVLFGEVSKIIASNKRLQMKITDSISRKSFSYLYLDEINDFLYMAYHYISINLTFKGKPLDAGKLDRPLTHFLKKAQK